MALFNIAGAKSDGELGSQDTRAVFKSSGTSFILNIGPPNEIEFFLKPRDDEYLDCFGSDSRVTIKDPDKTATGLVLNDGEELWIDATNVTDVAASRFFFSVSGEADFIFSPNEAEIYFDASLTSACSTLGCPACPPGSGRLFENRIGRVVNLDTTDFYEKDQAALISFPDFTTLGSGFYLLHAAEGDLTNTATPLFVVNHRIGLVEDEGVLGSGPSSFPLLENFYSSNIGTGINNDPFYGVRIPGEITSAETLKKIYLPSTVGHRGFMFKFARRFNPGGLEQDYYACMSYDEETNTLTLVPEDLPVLKKENGADGEGARSNSYLDTDQFIRMNAVPGSGTLADPYLVDLQTNILDVDFTTSGDVDNIVYFAFTLNFDDFLPVVEPEGYVFTVTTSPPPLGKTNVPTRIRLYGQSNFTAQIGEATDNFLQEPGHSTVFNTAFTNGDTVYVTVEKEGGGVISNDACRIYFTQGRKEFADGDTGFNAQSVLPGSGTIASPYRLTWEVSSGNFSFAMGTSPIYFVVEVQDDDFEMETFAPTIPYLTTGDTLITYYGTDSTFTTPISSDDNGSINPPLSFLSESLPGSPQDIFFSVDVGAGGAVDENREGYRIRTGQGAGAPDPGGNFTLLADTSTLPGSGTIGDCWRVSWNTIIEDIDFSEAGGTGSFYFCVSNYTATSVSATHLNNSLDVKATRSLNAGSDGGFNDAINSSVTVYDDAAFTNNVFDGNLNGSGGYEGKFQNIFDDNENKVEQYNQSDFNEGDTLYIQLDASAAGGGYGYGYGGGVSVFQAIFRSVQIEQRQLITDLTGDGSETTPYQIPFGDFFSVDNVSFDDGNVTDEVNFVVTNWQTTGAGSDFGDDEFHFYTTYDSTQSSFPDTIIEYYGTDSTYTTLVSSSDDDIGSTTFSRIEVFSQPNGSNHYFKVIDAGALGPGSGETFRISAGRIPAIVFSDDLLT